MKILTKLSIRTKFVFTAIVVSLLMVSCDEKVTPIGGDFINSLNLPEPYVVQHLASYNDKILSVQSNTLNNYLLGQFSDDVFGTTNTSILSQLELQSTNPDFGEDPVLDSVVLTLPLYSRITGFDQARNKDTYDLDSLFGAGLFRLQVFESNQFLNNVNPGDGGDFNENQIYYTDQLEEFEGNIAFSNPLTTIKENGIVSPSQESKLIRPFDSTLTHIIFDYNSTVKTELEDGGVLLEFDTLRLAPRISIKLSRPFFQQKILDANPNIFVSQNSFKNYFRGLFIKTTEHLGSDAMLNLNLNSQDANIRLYYRSLRPPPSLEIEDSPDLVETFNTFDLRFAGNTINFYDENSNLDLSSQDQEAGEELLYIKGGQGVVTIIDPFNGPDDNGNGIPDEIEDLRSNNWLVNEANLILYINDELADQIDFKPSRIFVYDIDRNSVLIDYVLDPFASNNPATSRINHLGPLEEDEDGNSFYKIRLTSHINNIINNDSVSTRIGVVATQNINEVRFLDIKESEQGQADEFIENSISTPRGTVFFGNTITSDNENFDKRLKLQIFYTEPNL